MEQSRFKKINEGTGVEIVRQWSGLTVLGLCEEYGWGRRLSEQSWQLSKQQIADMVESMEPSITNVHRIACVIACVICNWSNKFVKERRQQCISEIMTILENAAVKTEYRMMSKVFPFTPCDETIEEFSEEMRKQAEEDNDIPF